MSTIKFQKSLVVLAEMFEYRSKQQSLANMYKDAHDSLVTWLEDGSIESHPFLASEMKFSHGSIQLIYNLDDTWDPKAAVPQRIKLTIEQALEGKTHLILVLSKKTVGTFSHMSPFQSFVEKELQKTCEIFHLNDLQYNVTKHSLVPLHEIIDSEEVKENVLLLLKIDKLTKLPLILSSDPVARFIGARNGDLIKITRNPNHVGEFVLYRYCVNGT